MISHPTLCFPNLGSRYLQHNRDPVTFNLLWDALKDYDMWPIYIIGLTWMIPATPMSSYLTLTLKSLGFDTFTTNLLTIPASCVFIFFLILSTWISEKIDQRLLMGIFSQIWMIAPLIALVVMPADASKWARFAACTLLVGYIYVHAILVSLTSRNAGSVRTRTVGSALYNMFVQAGAIISSNIYRKDDAPLYKSGNKVLIYIAIWNIVAFALAKTWYMYRNKSRDTIWNGMTVEEKADYLQNTKDEGNKRLDFRFAH